MSPDNFNKDFSKAFTQDCILYSAMEEYRHGNLLFRQFAGDADVMKPVAISVANNMYQGKLVSRILSVLENKSIPQIALLCTTANKIIDEFNSYIELEPYTSTHCHELINTLESFLELANSLNNDLCGQVSNKLYDIDSSIYIPDRHVDIDGLYLYEVIDKIEFYLKNLLTYYYHFLIVWQQENENCKGLAFTTQVADHLWELTGIIEMASDNLEDILDMLLTWEERMDICEEQALFN